ncbi:MAG: class I SAM-dependent methyltransferase [Candidatus Paceibacterota bacterium]|jgi:ubiquinone/menaquinone biosynthesis C-methylase UbiE
MLIDYSNTVDYLLKGLRIKILENSSIKEDTLVLDVCCGTGDQAFYYAQKSNHVFGVDIDSKMIGLAQKRKKDDSPTLIVTDARKLPFEDNYFDLTSICLALHEKEEKLRNQIIHEMKRVTKKGGTIMIVDYNVPLPNNFLSLFIRIIEFFAGTNHFSCFNDYIKSGGTDRILNQNQLKTKEELLLFSRTIKLIKVVN